MVFDDISSSLSAYKIVKYPPKREGVSVTTVK
jgi:hypothetical protein